MFNNILKGLFRRPWMTMFCLLLMIALTLISLFAAIMSFAMGVVQMETHEFTEIATFQAGKGTRSSDRRDLLNRSSSLFENVVATDVRTFAAGYSETIEPIWIPHAGLTSYRPVQSPQDITVFIATCTDIQQTQTKINESYNEYTYTYTYSVD